MTNDWMGPSAQDPATPEPNLPPQPWAAYQPQPEASDQPQSWESYQPPTYQPQPGTPYQQQPGMPYQQQYGMPYQQQAGGPYQSHAVSPYQAQPGFFAGPPYGTPTMRPPVGMIGALKAFFLNYFRFDGRASRAEYWWVVLAYAIGGVMMQVLIGIAASAEGSAVATALAGVTALVVLAAVVGSFLPSISLTVRRLHDANLSGLLALLSLVPYLGGLILIVLCILPSNPAGARFDGPVQPRAGD